MLSLYKLRFRSMRFCCMCHGSFNPSWSGISCHMVTLTLTGWGENLIAKCYGRRKTPPVFPMARKLANYVTRSQIQLAPIIMAPACERTSSTASGSW
jgi:hypothetical protein